MKKEIQFKKYQKRGADYHYRLIDKWNFREFNPFVKARYEKHVQLILKYINLNKIRNKKIKVLDIGCGDGVLLYLLAKQLGKIKIEYYGIDLSKEALDVAKIKIPFAKFYQKGVYSTGFNNDFFDVIISSDVIEHVNFPEKMVKEMYRVSKKGSIIILGTPIRCTEKSTDTMHYHEFFQEELKSLMDKFYQPLTLIESHSLLPFLRYNTPLRIIGRKVSFFKYWINLQTYLGFNPFLREKQNKIELFVYMFFIGRKK